MRGGQAAENRGPPHTVAVEGRGKNLLHEKDRLAVGGTGTSRRCPSGKEKVDEIEDVGDSGLPAAVGVTAPD